MSKFKIEFKWAIYYTFLGIMWFQLEKYLGYHDEKIAFHPVFTNFIYIFIFLIYLLFLVDKKKNFFNGVMSWQQGLLSGVILALFAMVLTPFALYFSLKYVNPNFFESMINYSVSKGMKLENATALFDTTTYMLFAAFGTFSFGILFAALAAALIKTKK
ncbi:DUF4199 domain-containing protein [Flavobacterium difficile]|uniref:DUF4199 domain-containing protein n=1 Tax=Flavobacterium difficile TaxID=2709659 RepID=A0ABX0I5S5_9FLAO|nr:DUF4199 domain-containing protein [Flavobacterium difficile]NHM01498.1 DUF4199 domain-containing protein [Flavobacterium difficile]